MKPSTLQLLETLLMGQKLSVAQLDELVHERIAEDLYIDYKHGNLLAPTGKGKKPKDDPNDVIRQYMSGFANSAGGILIIGVDNKEGQPPSTPWEVTGCTGHTKGNLAEWAARCLNEMAGRFYPIPLFHTVSHPNGEVLVGVAQRAPNLIASIEAGQLVYYFRHHDQTLKASDYLIADMRLGRRQHAELDITDYRLVELENVHNHNNGVMDAKITISLTIENQSLLWVDETRIGLVGFIITDNGKFVANEAPRPSSHLLSFISYHKIDTEWCKRAAQLAHLSDSVQIEKPFDIKYKRISFQIPLRIYDAWFNYIWRGAFYIVAKNSPPIWYQVDIVVDNPLRQEINRQPQRMVGKSTGIINITPTHSERPIVAWEPIEGEIEAQLRGQSEGL